MTKFFVDTNVLAYAKDSRNPTKQTRAKNWIEHLAARRLLVISAQTVRELYAVRLRLDRTPEGKAQARAEAATLASAVPEQLREDRLVQAWAIEDAHRFQFFDCLLLASALAVGCTWFLSEDMQAGQKIGVLAIINPFATAPEDIFGT